MRTIPLGDIADIVSGATPKTSVEEYWGGDVQWATPADLSKLDGPYIDVTSRTLTSAGVSSCGTTILPAGSVLLSSRAPIGHVAINNMPMATNQGFKSLVPGPEVDAKYLYHWLRSKTSYLQSLGNGATFKELSKKTAERILVPLPLLDEQRRIAAILDQADTLRAKRRQALDHLGSLGVSIASEALSTTLPGSSDAVLGDIADVLTGFAFPSARFVSEGIRLCRGANVLPGRTNWTDLRCWSIDGLAGLDRFALSEGDIVLALDRPWISEGQKMARISKGDLPSLLVQRVARIRASSEELQGLVWASLASPNFQRYCRPTETTIPHISPVELRNYPIRVPPPSTLSRLHATTTALETQRSATRRQLAEMEELFTSVQSRAFRGEL